MGSQGGDLHSIRPDRPGAGGVAPPQLRGPTGIRLQNGWLLAFLNGVPISGVHETVGRYHKDFGVGMLCHQVESWWGTPLAEYLKTHKIEVDEDD
jgi:hypothetical protein